MKIAVTGATGHIGNNVCRKLINKGHQVHALVRNGKDIALQGLSIETHQGNLMNEEVLDNMLTGVDLLIHMAAIVSIDPADRENILKTNIEGPRVVVDACLRNGVKRIIHFSSIHAHKAFGPNVEINEETDYVTNPASAYDYSKAQGEAIMIAARKRGMDVTIVNPTGVIGPNDYKPSLTGQLFIKMLRGNMRIIVDSGFNWVDVRDVADAVVQIVEQNISNEKMFLSGHWRSLQTLGATTCSVIEQQYKCLALPFIFAYLGLPFIHLASLFYKKSPLYTSQSLKAVKEGSRLVSHQKANKVIGYVPRPFEDTIHDTVEFLLTKYSL